MSDTSDTILEMKHISKLFPGVRALDDVNLKVKRGEIHALCGENGAGKSTLMNILSGVYPYGTYSGDIFYNSHLCKFKNIKSSEEKGIVIIYQEFSLSPYLSIAENIFMGNEQTSFRGVINWTKTRAKAKEVLKAVGLENEDVNLPVNSLGVGKQQLVEIARALSKKVELLILDEPTAALNEKESDRLLDIMLELKAKDVTCIIISHKLNEIRRIADSITVLRDGKTIETLERDTDEISEERIIKGMVGRELNNLCPPRENCPIGEVVFEVDHWNVFHPDDPHRKIINDVSFHVRKGEVVGFAGLMGAGRTELAMSLFGKSYGRKISGDMKINGVHVNLKTVKDAVNTGLAYTSEDRKNYGLVLIDDLKHNMTMAGLPRFFSDKGVINRNNEILESEDYRTKINIKTPSINQTAGNLSGGNQQKVVLAKWMMAQPDVLILDEPTRGIDVGAKYEIYGVINSLAQKGKAVIMISSEMPEIIGMCDRVYVLSDGEIVGELQKEELSQENIMKCIMSRSGVTAGKGGN